MATKKKNSSRKALAVALGVMGVAGLSLASAAQLTVNTNSDNVAFGNGTFDAACDDSVNVAFTYDATAGTYTDLTISDIAAACQDGETLTYTLWDDAVTPAVVVTGTLPANLSASEDIDISAIALTVGFSSIDIVIE
ncbi:MAG: hypothetical protein CVT64_00085 [Actinobacteria bacterium HGW-Actinobacteria-4]|nr:MAG: hypothetical protein CVT64_00085 [Actinobacteria bacterium HGW-Actinobacteria-4]